MIKNLRLCPACKSAPCPTCGGCIGCGECICSKEKATKQVIILIVDTSQSEETDPLAIAAEALDEMPARIYYDNGIDIDLPSYLRKQAKDNEVRKRNLKLT